MGTNYYIIEKSANKLDNEIRQMINTINTEEITNTIEDVIKVNYQDVINVLTKNHLDHQIEMFNITLKEILSNIKSDLDYKLRYEMDIQEQYAKHIGKSSYGWLFGFQEQDEWHTYKEFKDYITSKQFQAKYDIIDEYNEIISPKEMLDIIDSKQTNEKNLANPDNFHYSENRDGYRFNKGDFS